MEIPNIQQATQITTPADVIDFGIGQPGFSLLPTELLRAAADHCLAQADPTILQYGAEAGDGRFRQTLARFLTEGYELPVSSEHLFVTNGVSQALDLICTLFTEPGDTIFVEEPTYFLALDIFADYQLQVKGVPTDEYGIIIEAVEEALDEQVPAFLYTIPTFQNPTGSTLPEERRQRLAQLSEKYEFLLVADEVYQLLPYTAVSPKPFARFDTHESILSLGSFSKILAPGLRLGWIQAVPARLQTLADSGLTQSGGGLNPFTAAIVRSLIEQGWQASHLDMLKQTYRRRASVLAKALQSELGNAVRFQFTGGGFFIWLTLPEGMTAARLLPIARAHQVSFQPGPKFSSVDGQQQQARLCFAFYDEGQIQEGVTRMKRAIEAYQAAA